MLVFLLSLFFSAKVYAQTYFDFRISPVILLPDQTTNIELLYDIGELFSDRFKLKVFSEEGVAEILIDSKNYVTGDVWTAQPNLRKSFKLRVNGSFLITKIWFEVFDTYDFKIYKTPKYTLVNYTWFKKYITDLNSHILKW